uniref:Uncharacterized protein n=1 Tax=Oryza nivara TaxID=4536 RepID=A0A0E0HPQ7_ORYNI|nr:hypothetical protein [Oryza sativa f. spontanea]
MSASSSPPFSTSLPLSSSFHWQPSRREGRRPVGEAAATTSGSRRASPHAAATTVADGACAKSRRHGSSLIPSAGGGDDRRRRVSADRERRGGGCPSMSERPRPEGYVDLVYGGYPTKGGEEEADM